MLLRQWLLLLSPRLDTRDTSPLTTRLLHLHLLLVVLVLVVARVVRPVPDAVAFG